ncbi:MAG: hypothetical protein IKN75_01515 [Prevotella sp.]|nr:hypothetical protein [Prevotella sp.]
MKRIYIISTLLSLLFVLNSCGGDSDDVVVSGELTEMYGKWTCVTSEDSYMGITQKDNFVGETLTINSDHTYTSSSYSFGYKGTWQANGNSFVAKASNGKTITATFSVSGNYMTLSGNASNDVSFNYHFTR